MKHMAYDVLGPSDRDRLRRERILQLEADYFRLQLVIDEGGEQVDEMRNKQEDLRTRIDIHRGSQEQGVTDE